MKVIFLALSLWLYLLLPAYGQYELSLVEAAKKKVIALVAEGNGGYLGHQLKLTLQNTSNEKYTIRIEAGTLFTCSKEEEQNLMVVKEQHFVINPSEKKLLDLFTMCIEAGDASPGRGAVFSLNGKAMGDLLLMADRISQGNYLNSTAQSAVWSITNGHSINEIFGIDTLMARNLVRLVSEATGQAIPNYIPPTPHNIVSVKGKMTYQVSQALAVNFAIYDSLDNVITQYLNNKKLVSGLHSFSFHLNRVAAEGTKFYVKLTDIEGNILKERMTEGIEEIQETYEPVSRRFYFDFELLKKYDNVQLAIFDESGEMVQEILKRNEMGAGSQAIAYTFYHNRGPEALFFVRLSSEGNLLKELLLKPKPSDYNQHDELEMEVKFLFPVRRPVMNAYCVVYDEFDQELRKVYKDKKLKSGSNKVKFTFTHRRGKKARFYVRIHSEGGRLIYQKMIEQE